MSRIHTRVLAGSMVLAFGLACSVAPALAQGTTSGPAAGGNVAPGGATHKGKSAASDQTTGTQMQQGNAAAGAPGVAAKRGSESGPPPAGNTTR